jgi:myo-inositol-1(or 4)-monophosphatase
MSEPPPLPEVAACVRAVAREELLPRFANVRSRRKHDGSLVSEADIAVQSRLIGELEAAWPGHAVLSEELPAHQGAALQTRETGIWCLDPLDGTSNFIAGMPYYAVSLAFLVQDRIETGIVYDPTRDECFTARRGQGARLNGEPLDSGGETPTRLADSLGLIDFKRIPPALRERLLRSPPYKSQRSLGAVALDWCWLADRRCHLYLHGRQRIWDYAAGLLILSESGGMAQTLDGESVFSPTLDPRSAVAACDSGLFSAWSTWLVKHT